MERNKFTVRADEAYRLSDLLTAAGLGHTARQQLVDGGLRLTRIGKSDFVLGTDFLDYLRENARSAENE
ncbi:MAG: hypothetical protein CMJ48_08165 [Planctomycetaceae bacterium]|nr:hypothetical protein [Planctomycetaceae bacterium]